MKSDNGRSCCEINYFPLGKALKKTGDMGQSDVACSRIVNDTFNDA